MMQYTHDQQNTKAVNAFDEAQRDGRPVRLEIEGKVDVADQSGCGCG